MTVWFDITTAASCSPPATGIPRVETRLADALSRGDPTIRFCLYEARLGRFSEVPVDDVRRLVGASAGSFAAIELTVHRRDRTADGGIGLFVRGDAIVTVGFNWRPDLGDMFQLYALRQAIGLRVVAMCHDLVPLRFPGFVPGMDAVFVPYVTDMAGHADHVLCNSRSTERDLLAWCDAAGTRRPPTSVMPLGCDGPTPDEAVVDERVTAVLATRFVLSVGTLEDRKNHRVLCRAYERLVAGGAGDLPSMVFVGRVGVGGAALIDEIAASDVLRGRVVVLAGVSDGALAALYAACLFTLCPSWYEGWGLPVSESLSHGKLCLSSDRGALPEAGCGLTELLDPDDADRWAAAIDRYARRPDERAVREAAIRSGFRAPRWRDAAAHVLSVLAARR